MGEAKEGVPPCTTCCATEWKAKEYDKKKFEGVWQTEKNCGGMCCDKILVTPHCCCYTCVCYYLCFLPILGDLTWTCGDNCWYSEGGSTYIYGEGDVVYHQWLCCPYEKFVRADGAVAAGAPSTGAAGAPSTGIEMER